MLQEYILSALKIMPERFEYIKKIFEHIKNKKEKPEKSARYYEFNNIMKKSIKNELEELLKLHKIQDIKITIHIEQGNPAYIPWFGFHYIKDKIDSNSQTGVYVTILFKADGSGIALSLQNGTEKCTIEQVCIKTETLKLKYKEFINNAHTFSQNKLNLKGKFLEEEMSRGEKYEEANILGNEYSEEQLKNNDCTLVKDLINLINYYKNFLDKGMNNKDLDIESETNYQLIELNLPKDKFEKLKNKHPKKRKKEIKVKVLISQKVEENDVKRDEIQGQIALQEANFKCEFDSCHSTFLKPNNHQFMEKHHLIPMKYYFDFENSIDDHNNIYSLCPTCHSRIHYAKSEDQKILIEKLFEKRKESYKNYYKINIKKLLELYGIDQ